MNVFLGRAFCEPCQTVRTVVYEAGVTEIRCPRCNNLTIPACGHDVCDDAPKPKGQEKHV